MNNCTCKPNDITEHRSTGRAAKYGCNYGLASGPDDYVTECECECVCQIKKPRRNYDVNYDDCEMF